MARQKVFLKWREGADGAGELKKERQEDAKTDYCRVCKNLDTTNRDKVFP